MNHTSVNLHNHERFVDIIFLISNRKLKSSITKVIENNIVEGIANRFI